MKHTFFLIFLLLGCAGHPSATVADDPGFGGPPSGVDPWPAGRTDARSVRVGLVVAEARLQWTAAREVELRDLVGRSLGRHLPAGRWTATRAKSELVLTHDGSVYWRGRSRGVWLRAAEDRPSWEVGGDRFAGDLAVVVAANGSLTLVNRLPVEEYLRGVVPWEIGRPGDDALEAVKAQAIAARTYTYAHFGHWASSGFDLFADVRDQVYRGRTGTADITDRAVRETRDRVATYEGELIRAYYSSTSGGHTSNLTDVWTKDGAPYLVGGRDADAGGRSWCADSPQFRWTEGWSARELGDAIRTHLPGELDETLTPHAIGILDSLEVLARDRSGRVQRLRLHTDRASFDLWGDRIRWVLRPVHSRFSILRSTMFEVDHVRREGRLVGVILRGGGFGHGVGLCQTGSLARARAGQSHRDILRAYYPGIELKNIGSVSRGRPPAR